MSYYRGKIPSSIIRAAKLSRYRDRRNRHGKRGDGIRSRNPRHLTRRGWLETLLAPRTTCAAAHVTPEE